MEASVAPLEGSSARPNFSSPNHPSAILQKALPRLPSKPHSSSTMSETNVSNVHELQPTINPWDLASDTVAQTEPPTDGGRDAWLVLTSSFVLGAIVWGNSRVLLTSYTCLTPLVGFPYSFGVFQEYYLRQEQFSGSPSGVAAIGTTATVRRHICSISMT